MRINLLSCRINSLSRVASGWNTGTHTAGSSRVGAVRFALSCYTHEPRRAHKTNIPNSHILPPTTGLQLFLMWQEGAGGRRASELGVGRAPGGVVRNSVRRPNTMFQPQMGHISSPQSTNLLLPSLHTLNVWRGKKKEGGVGIWEREKCPLLPQKMLILIARRSL